MQIDKILKIAITQEDVEQAITEFINRADPTVIVDEIVFAAKRNGDDKIGVTVNGHFTDGEPTPRKVEPKKTVKKQEEQLDIFPEKKVEAKAELEKKIEEPSPIFT